MSENFMEPSLPTVPKVEYDPKMWDRNKYARNYLVLTALRGPDVECVLGSVLKSIITRRLRAIVFTRKDCEGDYADTPLQFQHLRELEPYLRQLAIQTPGAAPKLSHFVTHLNDALTVTNDHPIWSGYADDLRALLRIMLHELRKHECYGRYNGGQQ